MNGFESRYTTYDQVSLLRFGFTLSLSNAKIGCDSE